MADCEAKGASFQITFGTAEERRSQNEMTVLESHHRELKVAERRVLQSNIRRAKLQSRRAARPYSSIGIFVTLWLLSIVAGAPAAVVTMFWLIVGGRNFAMGKTRCG